jgi:hypothetical protein
VQKQVDSFLRRTVAGILVLEYGRPDPSRWDRAVGLAVRCALPVLLLAACGGIGGYIGYRFRPVPTITRYWKVELSGGARTPGTPALSDNFSPSAFFRPLAVGALRRAGLVHGKTDNEVSRSIFIFVQAPKPARNAAIDLGFDSPSFQVSERGAKVLATEVGSVLNTRAMAHHAYALTSWSVDDHGGSISTVAPGALAGIGTALVAIIAMRRRSCARPLI